jgi:hypothetical protein
MGRGEGTLCRWRVSSRRVVEETTITKATARVNAGRLSAPRVPLHRLKAEGQAASKSSLRDTPTADLPLRLDLSGHPGRLANQRSEKCCSFGACPQTPR